MKRARKSIAQNNLVLDNTSNMTKAMFDVSGSRTTKSRHSMTKMFEYPQNLITQKLGFESKDYPEMYLGKNIIVKHVEANKSFKE